MATIDSRVRSGVLKFTAGTGTAKDFSAQATSVSINPSVNESDPVEVLSGDKVGGGSTTADTLAFTIISDLTSADGLVAYSWLHRGATITWEFTPDATPANKWQGTCVMQALQVGGAVGEQLSVDGELTIVSVTPPTGYGDGGIHPGVPVALSGGSSK